MPKTMLGGTVLEITAWSLMQCQTLIVTVSTLACQQHDASATIKKEDAFSCCISARDMTPSAIFSLLLNLSDSGVLKLGSMMDDEEGNT